MTAYGRGAAQLGAIVLLLFAPTPARAYRTLADDPEFASADPPPRWAAPHLAFDIHAELPVPLPAAVEQEFDAAAAAWEASDCTALRFDSNGVVYAGARPDDDRNTIEIVTHGWDPVMFQAESGATADVQLTRAPDGTWAITEADVYVDWSGHDWALGEDLSGYSLRLVLRHELGHALGLLHPCEIEDATGPACSGSDYDSVLFPLYGDVAALSDDDRAGVCALYPAVSCEANCPAGTTCESGICVGCGECAPRGGCDAGACGPECTSDSECAASDRCVLGGRRVGECAARGADGTACSSGADCASTLCLAGARPTPYCTSACTDDDACAPGEICASVESRDVCAPRPSATCSADLRGSRRAPAWTLIVLVLALGVRRSRQ